MSHVDRNYGPVEQTADEKATRAVGRAQSMIQSAREKIKNYDDTQHEYLDEMGPADYAANLLLMAIMERDFDRVAEAFATLEPLCKHEMI